MCTVNNCKYTVYTIQCKMDSGQNLVYSGQYTVQVYCISETVQIIHCTAYTAQCSVHGTVYSVLQIEGNTI